MNAFTRAFADELLKTAGEKKRGSKKSYLRSALIGATALPLADMAGIGIARLIHNRDVANAIAHGAIPSAKLMKRTGPLMSRADIAGKATAGALGGSAIQWMRDNLT